MKVIAADDLSATTSLSDSSRLRNIILFYCISQGIPEGLTLLLSLHGLLSAVEITAYSAVMIPFSLKNIADTNNRKIHLSAYGAKKTLVVVRSVWNLIPCFCTGAAG